MFLLVGITINCKKYDGSCENLLVDEDNVMDVRSKGSDSRSIPTGMTPKTSSSSWARRESKEECLIKKSRIWLWEWKRDTNSAKETDICLSTEKGIKPGFVADVFACFFQMRDAGQAAVLGQQQPTWAGVVQKGIMCTFLIRMLCITFVVSQPFWVVAPCYSHFTSWYWGKGLW